MRSHKCLTMRERKFVPLCDNRFPGTPKKATILSKITLAMVGALILDVASATGHFVKLSMTSTMYLLPFCVVVKGPIQSIFHHSKVPTIGTGQSGALWHSLALFFCAQCLHDFTQEVLSCN